jgi:hypothetical protein
MVNNEVNNDIGITQFQISKVSIEFHYWMLKNDTIENADKYFHWSDEDMFNEFLKQT